MKENSSHYFIGVLPSDHLYEQISSIKLSFSEKYRSIAALRVQPHITLHMPFYWPNRKEQELVNSLQYFSKMHKAFELTLAGYGSFPPKVIFIDVKHSEPLRHIQSLLHRFCKIHFGVLNANYKDLPFHPHITIAFRDLKKPSFYNAWEEYRTKPFDGIFKVCKLYLLKQIHNDWTLFEQLDLINK